MVRARANQSIAWTPQPGPQQAFVNSEVFEVVYGGARGGGKTDASLGDFALHAQRYGADAKGLFVRRTRVALEPTIARARQLYLPAGVAWRAQQSQFRWPSGAVLYFRYLDQDADADAYQGHDYTRVYVEELTQFPNPSPVDKLKATLRSAAGAPCGFRATCNPGGPGHTWVKARYIDPGPWTVIEEVFESPFDSQQITLSRLFIPARLTDNPRLLQNDPLYVAKLQQSGSAQLVRAWLEGDWGIVEGAFFDNWSAARNVVRPFEIPPDWTRFRSLDWGSARPFSVGWWAVVGDATQVGGVRLARGALVRYREWYGRGPKPNEGLKMTAEAVARGVLARDAGERIAYGVADPSIFASDGGPSLAERMYREGLAWRRADNARVARGGAMGGWDQMRARIGGDEAGPGLVVFSTCLDFIRTVPVLQHDADRPEDVDTDAEDHAADEARYACMSRPYAAASPSVEPAPRGLADLTFDEVLALHEAKAKSA
ncbi:MAG TPA: terminase family protein [Caulobacteraceae bacterium]|nr:terminase family protein [Caulobacteraceae bacterium]